MFELYDFTFSHYSEKARWALDFKGVPYTPRHLLPGFHMRTARKLAPRSSIPILKTDSAVIQGSTEIIDFLEQTFPDRSLTPPEPRDANSAIEWEKYLDVEVGVTLRLWFYYHALPNRDRALRFILEGGPWYGRPLFVLIFPKVRERMMALMNINTVSAGQAEDRLLAALKKLDDALEGRRFLAGDGFSRADLTACALLSPYVRPGESDAQAAAALPDYVRALRDQHKIHCYFGWVREMYRDYRPLSSASPRLAA
jgi:glutathione S-transferase